MKLTQIWKNGEIRLAVETERGLLLPESSRTALQLIRGGKAAMEALIIKHIEFNDCDLTRATIFRTPLKGLDMTTCTLDGLMVNLPDLRGMIVTPLQAAELAKLLGLVVR